MSQDDFGTIDPNTKSGTALATDLNDWRTSVHTSHSGTTAPSYIVTGMQWADSTSSDLIMNMYDGTDSIPLFQLDSTNNWPKWFFDADSDSYVTSTADDVVRFYTGGTEAFRMDSTQKVTIGEAAIESGTVVTDDSLSYRNKIINGNFDVNQRVVSGTVTLAAGEYGHDRWKGGSSGATYTFATSANITTITITAGSLVQTIKGTNLQSGTHTLSWTGTAQGKIGAGSFSSTGVTGTATGGTNLDIEFNTGTLSLAQFEKGSVATPFEFKGKDAEEWECLKYYWRFTGSVAQEPIVAGYFEATNTAAFVIRYPRKMVGIPHTFTGGGNLLVIGGTGSTFPSVGPTYAQTGPETTRAFFTVDGTAGNGCVLRLENTSSYIGVSAEL